MRLGLFGGSKPHAAWAGVAPSEPLTRLQAKLDHAARSALEHRELPLPDVVDGAVEVGPVGGGAVPGAAAALHHAIAAHRQAAAGSNSLRTTVSTATLPQRGW